MASNSMSLTLAVWCCAQARTWRAIETASRLPSGDAAKVDQAEADVATGGAISVHAVC